jgi:hypothetical protein
MCNRMQVKAKIQRRDVDAMCMQAACQIGLASKRRATALGSIQEVRMSVILRTAIQDESGEATRTRSGRRAAAHELLAQPLQ